MSWQVASTLIVALAVAAGLAWYERTRPPSKVVALVAALAALAVAGRVLFAAVPNVQATTDVALLAGYVLGPAPGFAVGSLAALASNVFLGQGPWTPWEMLGWGAAGVAGAALAALAGRRLGRGSLALACAVAGLAFGAWMDLFTLLVFAANDTAGSYAAIAVVSLPFNVAHAVGNALLCLAFGPAFVRMLARFRRRLEVTWSAPSAPAPSAPGPGAPPAAALRIGPGPSAAALVLVAAAGLLAAPAPDAHAGTRQALRYLESAQNRDGGFGAAPGQPSNQLMTGWVALGLEAGGRSPLDVRRAGATPIAYMRAGAARLRDTGEIERTVLALRGARVSARSFAGRDLVAALLRRRASDGSWERGSTLTAFGILALRSAGYRAGSGPVRRAAGWLARQQNEDGGYSYAARGGAGFVDDTGAALQALAASGRRRGLTARRATSFLRRAQNADGGFGQSDGQRSNAQSTAWAVQGLVAAGRDPRGFESGGRSPLAYLASLQQGDGSFRYSRTSTQTPVWVTSQALAALRREPLPIRRPPGRARAVAAAAGGPAASAGARGRGDGRPRESGNDGAGSARAKRPDPAATSAAVVPRRPPPARSVSARPASAVSAAPDPEEGGGPSPALVAAAAALAGASAFLAARWLRRTVRRPRA